MSWWLIVVIISALFLVGALIGSFVLINNQIRAEDRGYARLRKADLSVAETLGSVSHGNRILMGTSTPESESTTPDAQSRTEPDDDRLALAALWTVTHERLDLYHRIATGQARRSFITAQIAMIVGFALLIGFAILATRVHTTASAITTGSLGAVAAAFAGYIGRTFVRSQESAASHLRAYFDQPLEFSKYLAAERLLSASDGLTTAQQAKILSALIEDISAPLGKKNKIRRTRAASNLSRMTTADLSESCARS